MTKFSANLGFLWTDRSLPDAIRAAKSAGFDAVECHWPYDTPAEDVAAALTETNLTMLGLNTRRGNPDQGDNGLAAIPDRVEEARAAIDEAINYAVAIGTANIHVMAGFAQGKLARDTFITNLRRACDFAGANNQSILIEPLNTYDAPGYFLSTTTQAEAIIEDVGADNLKLMFDCYHVQLMEGDLSNKLERLKPVIGHIQFASVPDRGAPDHGEINYSHLFKHIDELGYDMALGAEYKPQASTDDTLDWLKSLKQ
ncbi:MAG: hydroxypyruvate isomerase family protein [Rhizobiaceae bacterium]